MKTLAIAGFCSAVAFFGGFVLGEYGALNEFRRAVLYRGADDSIVIDRAGWRVLGPLHVFDGWPLVRYSRNGVLHEFHATCFKDRTSPEREGVWCMAEGQDIPRDLALGYEADETGRPIH